MYTCRFKFHLGYTRPRKPELCTLFLFPILGKNMNQLNSYYSNTSLTG